MFASHVYRNNNSRLPNGWKELTILDDSETGLQSTLYKRIGSKDYIYAFAGTQNLKDWQKNGSSDKVRGIPTQIYQRYMIDFP